MAVFILEVALFVGTNLGELNSLFVWLFVCSIQTGTRRIIRLDELSSMRRLIQKKQMTRLTNVATAF